MPNLEEIPSTLGLTGDPPPVPPPLEPSVDVPPFDRIPPLWFERLCLDVATACEQVSFRLYAMPGQRDDGIDMYGPRPDGTYIAWQVKRRAAFSPSALRAAIEAACAGETPFPISRLVVAGCFDDRNRNLLDTLERCRASHPELEIDLVGHWQLTETLRQHREIVRTHLGLHWAEHLCPGGGPTTGDAAWTRRAKPASAWSPQQLGVHPAISGRYSTQDSASFILPAYVERPHDAQVRTCLGQVAATDATQLVVICGGSCSGKTRTAFEAVRERVPHWSLHRPATAADLLAGLEQDRPEVKSVLWLDDLHRYLEDDDAEQVAAALRRHLDRPGPMVVVATIWPEAYKRLRGSTGSRTSADHQADVLFRGAITIDVPTSFGDEALAQARALEDESLRDALRAARTGDVCQTLAAGPELLARWLHGEDPYARALITAAIDARRHRLPPTLTTAFLKDAASGYLSDGERASACVDCFERALSSALQPVRGVASALMPVPRDAGIGADTSVVRLADYLEQQGSTSRDHEPAPPGFWDAALRHLDASVAPPVARSSEEHQYRRIAATLYRRAAEEGDAWAAGRLSALLARAGHDAEATRWLWIAAESGDTISIQTIEFDEQYDAAPNTIIRLWQSAAEQDTAFAMWRLTGLLERDGRSTEAARWWQRGVQLGDRYCAHRWAGWLAQTDDVKGAERLWRRLIEQGDTGALVELLDLLIETGRAGDLRDAWRDGFAKGCRWPFVGADIRRNVPDRVVKLPIREWLHELADAGDTRAMCAIARSLLPAPLEFDDDEPLDDAAIAQARRLLKRAVEAGSTTAATMLEDAPLTSVERERAARGGDIMAMCDLAFQLERAGVLDEAETWWRKAASGGSDWACEKLADAITARGGTVLHDELFVARARRGSREACLAMAAALEQNGQLAEAEAQLLVANSGFGSRMPLIDFLRRHGRLSQCEQRARTLMQGTLSYDDDIGRARRLLEEILHANGRGDEVERIARFGLEPGGSTANLGCLRVLPTVGSSIGL